MDVQETALPGVGLRHEFTTRAGRQLGVVSYRTGRRDLLLHDRDDPDVYQEVIRLTQEEADALADLLGAARLAGHLAELQQQIEGLAISWLTIQESSPYAGGAIADTRARSRTGVSIVAVLCSDGLPRSHSQLRLPGWRHRRGGRHPGRRPGPGQTPGRLTGMAA
jgi:TrkA domain protein